MPAIYLADTRKTLERNCKNSSQDMDAKYDLKEEKGSKKDTKNQSAASQEVATKRAPPPPSIPRGSTSEKKKGGAMVSASKFSIAPSQTGTLTPQAEAYIRSMEEGRARQQASERKDDKKSSQQSSRKMETSPSKQENASSSFSSSSSSLHAPVSSSVSSIQSISVRDNNLAASDETTQLASEGKKKTSAIAQLNADKAKHISNTTEEKKTTAKTADESSKSAENQEIKDSQEELPFDQSQEEIDSLKLEGYLSTEDSTADIIKKWAECEEVECVVENSTEKTIGGHFLSHMWAIGLKTKTPFEVREGIVTKERNSTSGWFSPVCSPLLYSAAFQEALEDSESSTKTEKKTTIEIKEDK